MPKFKYVAMDSNGAEKEGTVEAASQTQAIAKIRSQDMFPTRVVELGAGGGGKKAKGGAKGGMSTEIKMPSFMEKRVKAKELSVFTRQLATLVDAGLPLLRGLKILLKQEKHPRLRDALVGMGDAVEGGSTFSEALAGYPKIFDNLFVNMVRAGEAGGVLDVVLARLSEFMEKAEKVKGKVKSAMVYPVVVLVAAFGILAFMLTSVIPKFEEIFNDLLEGEQLPGITRFVIALSNAVKNNGIMILIGIAVIVILYKMWVKTVSGRFIMDKVGLKAPVFGDRSIDLIRSFTLLYFLFIFHMSF